MGSVAEYLIQGLIAHHVRTGELVHTIELSVKDYARLCQELPLIRNTFFGATLVVLDKDVAWRANQKPNS